MHIKHAAAGLAIALLISVAPLAVAWAQEAPPQIVLGLEDARPSSELSAQELEARILLARAAMKEDISGKKRKELRRMIRDDELALRKLTQSAPGEAAPPPEPDQQAAQQAEPVEAQPPAAGAVDPAIEKFVDEKVRLQDLKDAELQARFDLARQYARSDDLPKDWQRDLRAIMSETRAEIQLRRKAAKAKPPETAPAAQAETPETTPAAEVEAPAAPEQPAVQKAAPEAPLAVDPLAQEADKLIADTRTAADLKDEALRRRIQQARTLLANEALPVEYRAPLNALVVSARGELTARAKAAGATEQVQQADEVDTRAERRAQELLADKTPADRLRDGALRRRLEAARDLLSEGGLSRQSERALRQRLAADRAVLRARVAETDAEGTRGNVQEGLGGIFRDGRGPDRAALPADRLERREIERVLADRRRPEALTPTELTTRITVYRDLMDDPRYSSSQRYGFRTSFEESRQELRSRYTQDRRQRAERLRRPPAGLDIGINIDLGGQGANRGYYDDVWAAEADDEQIERQLIARPRQLPPQYSYSREALMRDPYPVMSRPEVRRSLPAVELDTVHFGFNEAVLREEEVANLDRLGRIIERILAAHPEEVFMIEGHTDAVGSDAYNLALSRQRAESVRRALLEYYVIAPENLSVVGLGERYLKIPTPDPEQENRRVSVRRVTPLMSGYQGGEE